MSIADEIEETYTNMIFGPNFDQGGKLNLFMCT